MVSPVLVASESLASPVSVVPPVLALCVLLPGPVGSPVSVTSAVPPVLPAVLPVALMTGSVVGSLDEPGPVCEPDESWVSPPGFGVHAHAIIAAATDTSQALRWREIEKLPIKSIRI